MDAQALTLPLEDERATSTRYTLAFSFLPPSKNAYDGWPPAWKASAKRKWMRAVARACAEANVPADNARVGLSATLYFPTKARRDVSNYAQALWNWVPDALQACGVLRDDRDGAVVYGPNLAITMAVDSRPLPRVKRQRTEITIEVWHS